MPFAVALLAHPAGAYAFLMVAVASLVYGAHTRSFLPLFTGVSAALLTGLSFIHVRPSSGSLALLAVAVALLHAEFRLPTAGVAGILGVGAATWGSWVALGSTAAPLGTVPRALLALTGAAGLLLTVGRAWRRTTLPPRVSE